MLRKLVLRNFKNFRRAELALGSFTVLVGTNASGKSNLRDAFRFLHGISRGYTLAEVLGEKWVEGGVLQWKGIRGGTREAAFRGAQGFILEAEIEVRLKQKLHTATYHIAVATRGQDGSSDSPRVSQERLTVSGYSTDIFNSHPGGDPSGADRTPLHAQVRQVSRGRNPVYAFLNDRPILSQLADDQRVQASVRETVLAVMGTLRGMRFLDLSPDAMRQPSIPGQTVLSDRGENLSSVLQVLCGDPAHKQALTEWVLALTPMDVVDFEFPTDLTGRTLVTLVEAEGHRISANSASDGTLRFLAMIAALLGPEPARFYFFEELENGIHPTRLDVLLQLIEQNVSAKDLQVVATTHSPQLLRLLSSDTLEHAALIYRLENDLDARIRRLKDIPEAKRILQRQDLGRLFESGWMETSVAFDREEAENVAEALG